MGVKVVLSQSPHPVDGHLQRRHPLGGNQLRPAPLRLRRLLLLPRPPTPIPLVVMCRRQRKAAARWRGFPRTTSSSERYEAEPIVVCIACLTIYHVR